MRLRKAKKPRPPDADLYLNKEEILEVLDLVIEHWQKKHMANWVYIQTIRGIKLAISVMDEELLMTLWKQIVRVFNHIYSMSEFQRMSGEMPRARFFIDKFKEEMRNGRVFDDA